MNGSEQVSTWTLALAQATNASITLAHVAHVAGAGHDHTASTASTPSIPSIPSITAYLATIRETLVGQGPKVAMRIVRGTSVVGALTDLADASQTDVVAIAPHARQGLEQPLLGKVGDHLIRGASASVLVTPPEVEEPSAPPAPPAFHRILVPLDGSPLAEQALGPAVTLAQHARGPMEIVLFYVEEMKDTRQDGPRYLWETRAALVDEGLPETVRVIASTVIGSPPGAIVGAATHGLASTPDAASGPFDLLVMATHGRGGVQRWLYGSVASYVIPRLTIPALLVHAPH